MKEQIRQLLTSSIDTKQKLLNDEALLNAVQQVVDVIVNAFNNGNSVYFCGNGGSAADAQHLAAEFSGRFYKDRKALPAEALHCNTSYLTAVANDYGFDRIYARLIEGIGKKGDVLIGLSTSGNSKNIVAAFETAQSKKMVTVAFTGITGGVLKTLSDYLINIPSSDTPRIQECHMLLGHIICQLVEEKYFGSSNQKQNSSPFDLKDIDKTWTLFLDRDGVINEDKIGSYIFNAAEFTFITGAPELFKKLTDKFKRIIVVTNQRGISKGLMTLEDLDAIHNKMLTAVEAAGGKIEKIYFATANDNKDFMRKPNAGMALAAKHDFPDIDFSKSIMVGNNITDMEFARNAGMYAVFLSTTMHVELPNPLIDMSFKDLKEFAESL